MRWRTRGFSNTPNICGTQNIKVSVKYSNRTTTQAFTYKVNIPLSLAGFRLFFLPVNIATGVVHFKQIPMKYLSPTTVDHPRTTVFTANINSELPHPVAFYHFSVLCLLFVCWTQHPEQHLIKIQRLERGGGGATKPKIWTHRDTKILKIVSPLGYQNLKYAPMRPIEIPFHRVWHKGDTGHRISDTGFFPQNWGIMWFELIRGTDCRILAGLCQGALYLWYNASGEGRKPNRIHYVCNVN